MISQEEREKALEAGRILSSPVFREAFDKLDSEYVNVWRTSTDSKVREDAWYKQRVLFEIQKTLQNHLECAALRERGKDTEINAALGAAKRKRVNHG